MAMSVNESRRMLFRPSVKCVCVEISGEWLEGCDDVFLYFIYNTVNIFLSTLHSNSNELTNHWTHDHIAEGEVMSTHTNSYMTLQVYMYVPMPSSHLFQIS